MAANDTIGRKRGFIPRKSYPQVNDTLLHRMFESAGIDPLLAGQFAKVLRQILDKQAIDERLNYTAIEDALGGGKEYATIVIAANNSTDHGKDTADVVATGTADDVGALTEAIGLLDPDIGGHIVLLEGDYGFSTGLSIDVDNVWISGQGESTRIRPDVAASVGTSLITLDAENVRITDMTISGTDEGNSQDAGFSLIELGTGALYARIQNCFLHGHGGPGIRGTTAWILVQILANHFVDIEGAAIFMQPNGDEINNGIIVGNFHELSSGAEFIDWTDSDWLTVTGNDVQGAILLTNIEQATISGNTLPEQSIVLVDSGRRSNITGNTCSDISLTDCAMVEIGPNVAGRLFLTTSHGINVVGGTYTADGSIMDRCDAIGITGTSFGDTDYLLQANEHVLTLTSVDDSNFVGLRINRYGASETATVLAGILVTSNSDNNTIADCMFRADAATQANYAVWIDNANCDANRVIDNDWLGFYSAAALQDAGTGTVVANGNRG